MTETIRSVLVLPFAQLIARQMSYVMQNGDYVTEFILSNISPKHPVPKY